MQAAASVAGVYLQSLIGIESIPLTASPSRVGLPNPIGVDPI